jgi:1-deoxy-D-xylulose-5-phosphate reductoisomerase
MEVPILYALSHPMRLTDDGVRRFDPVAAGPLTFEPLRHECFPAFRLGIAAGRAGGTMPAAFNAANEVAVAAFLAGQLGFGDIAATIDNVLSQMTSAPADSLDAIRAADADARRMAHEVLA